jgi:type IV pilus assembly protein PilA
MNREDWSEKNVAQKGFTLIELLVVIAILGILAVVGVLAFGGLTDSAHTASAKTEFTQVETAAQAYLAEDATHAVGDLTTPADVVHVLFLANLLKKDTGNTVCTYAVAAGVLTQGGPAGKGCNAANTDTL